IDSDLLLYGGASLGTHPKGYLIRDLPHRQNALKFEFSLPSYNDVSGNEYQNWLEGKDPGWSDWTRETSKNYTNLMEGTYRFHVRGLHVQGIIWPTSSYVRNILPPLYRSMGAYGVYLLMIIVLAQVARRYQHMVVEPKRAKEQERELIS